MLDQIKNFAKVTVATGYDSVATSINLTSGGGARLPDPASGYFNLVWWNSTDYPDPSDDPNVEIVRCTGVSTDTLTIVRPAVGNSYNGETSSNTAKTHNTVGKTYKMALTLTYKTMTDLSANSWRIADLDGSINGMNITFTIHGGLLAVDVNSIMVTLARQSQILNLDVTYSVVGGVGTITYAVAPDASLSGQPHKIQFI